MIYECMDCAQHYCATCDGGEDQCKRCHLGPLCPDCAYENHKHDHDQEENDGTLGS